MKKQNKIIKHLLSIDNLYQIKIGNINVEMSYSKNQKKIDECLLNILKQKRKMS